MSDSAVWWLIAAAVVVGVPLLARIATSASTLRPMQVVSSPADACAQVAGPSADVACGTQGAHIPAGPAEHGSRTPLVHCAHQVATPAKITCRELDGP